MKPMLAGKCIDLNTLRFPIMVSVKLDGVRALIVGGKVLSRNLKPIPNRYVQQLFAGLPEGTDGELILGNPTAPDAYRKTVSAVMTESGKPEVTFWVFDNFQYRGGFNSRYNQLMNRIGTDQPRNVKLVEHSYVQLASTVTQLEQEAVEAGHEGIMVRDPNGPYKHGRSTDREGYLLKVKRFEDSEAKVIGTEEQMHNANFATKNALGHTERSSHKAGMEPTGMLGALIVRDLKTGVEFNIGTGFEQADRIKLWKQRKELSGKIAKYKYFPSGSKDKPRFPVFLGWRDPIDL